MVRLSSVRKSVVVSNERIVAKH